MTSGSVAAAEGASMEFRMERIFSAFWAVSTRSNEFLVPKTDICPFLDTSGCTAEKASCTETYFKGMSLTMYSSGLALLTSRTRGVALCLADEDGTIL